MNTNINPRPHAPSVPMNQFELEKALKAFKSSKPDAEWAPKAIGLIAALEKRIKELEYRLEQEYRDPGGKSWTNVR
jgi:hypothetical protein